MTLLKDLKTYKNVQAFKSVINDFNLKLSGVSNNKTSKVIKECLGDMEEVFAKEFRAKTKKDLSKAKVKDLVTFAEALVKDLENINTVETVLAFEPSDKTLDKILDWLHKEVANDIVLQIKHDPKIVGGVVITYKGKYLDLSLEKKLRDLFEQRDIKIK